MKEMLKDMWKFVTTRNYLIVLCSIAGVIICAVGATAILQYIMGADSKWPERIVGVLLIPVGIYIIVKITNALKK